MQKFALAAALVSLVPYFVAGVEISTPQGVVECQPTQITLGGTGPFWVSVLPGGQPGGASLKEFPQQDGTTLTWQKVDIPGGTSISLRIKDSTGAINYSDKIQVGDGDKSCLSGGAATDNGAGSSTAAGPDAGPSQVETSSAGTSAATHSSVGTTSSHATTGGTTAATRPNNQAVTTGASASGSAARPSASGAAVSQFSLAKAGVAGAMAVVGAVLF